MMNVYLDDLRPCPKGFKLARSVEQCIDLMKAGPVNILSLDHDLGLGKASGYDLVKYMVAKGLYAKKEIIIHSANPIGRHLMWTLLHKHKPNHVKLSVRPEPLAFKI
ncbi:cyclic-phosphate processing receiver domain-containing protein [Paenibacillus oleatilyticus]|uniref:Cyclic-phosphate processing receiver domain-containing protein n=1 Tax=Paenibacillus oleatilyticus TaxID=2594886 RepID=A0ABV4UWB4_9BACL